MLNKRLLTLLSVLMLLTFTAAACGDGNSTGETPADTGDVTSSEGITDTETTVEETAVEETDAEETDAEETDAEETATEVVEEEADVEDTEAMTDTESMSDGEASDSEAMTDTEEMSDSEMMTETDMMTDTESMSDGEAMTGTEDMSDSEMMTGTDMMTDTGTMTDTESMTDTEEMSDSEMMTGTDMMTDTESMSDGETMTDTGSMTGTESMSDTGGLPGAGDRVMLASTLSDYSVQDSTGENLGTVRNEVIDLNTGQVEYLVLSFGGFLGIADTEFAIPLSAFTFEAERIEEVDMAAPADAGDGAVADPAQPITDTADPAAAPVDPAAAPVGDAAAAPAPQVYVPPRLVLDITEERLEGAPVFDADTTLGDDAWADDVDVFWDAGTDEATEGMTPSMILGSTLEGYGVENVEEENLGNVEDFVVNLENGTVEYFVLSFGGFLGIGDTRYAVPMSAFTFENIGADAAEDLDPRVVLSITEEELEGAPEFLGQETLVESTWNSDVDSFWGVESVE